MANVVIDKNKIDILANAISIKSGEPVTMTLAEMVEAVDGIETGGGTPTLQAKTYTVDSAGTETITADSGYDGLSEVEVEVPTYTSSYFGLNQEFYTDSGVRKWHVRPFLEIDQYEGGNAGWIAEGNHYGSYLTRNAIPTGTTVTPTTSSQTIGGSNYMMEGAVTVSAMPTGTAGTPTATKGTVSNHSVSVTPSVTNTTGYITGSTKTGTAVSVSASELVSGTYTVDSSGTKDVTNYASASVPSGTAGTPSATKGTVSNHSVSVTPSVTNTTGWITGSTKTGTAVTVTAAELASGNKEITANGTNIDVVGYSTVSVDVQGGGGSSLQVDFADTGLQSATSSISFTGLSGEPTAFILWYDVDDISTGTPARVSAVVFDGTNFRGSTVTNTSNAQASYNTGFSKSYSSGTLTVTATSAQFLAGQYALMYTYNGGTVATLDVQVGSGATSITFTGLEDEPVWWSCIFKSNFGTSSGYQRVMWVSNNGGDDLGMSLDSAAHLSASNFSTSYSNGSFTISSAGTNAGGYFHQPGYYQLTYAYDATSNYQSKTVTPSTSQQVITADSGYDALKKVTVDAMPEMTLPTASSATSSGTSKATITPSSSTQYLNIPTGYNGTAQYYTIAASGGSGTVSVATTTWTNSSNTATSHQFTGLSGTPKFAVLRCTSSLSRSSSSTNYFVADIIYNGTSCVGNSFRRSNGTYANKTTGYSATVSGTSITFTSSGTSTTDPGSFYNGTYELIYVY